MGEREKIAERLRKKEAEIQLLEEKTRAARVYAQALQDVLKLLDQANSNDDGAAPSEAVLRAGSLVDKARDVIISWGKPVHINDLLAAVGREPTRESRASLTSSLAAYVRRGDIFTRPAPNTFGLIELGHQPSASEEPPQSFGRDTPSASPRIDPQPLERIEQDEKPPF